jgi:catechol 2,3-dioxygenase-like lactoylglutathione lyase family enzyme
MIIKNIGTHIKVANFEKSRKFYESLGFKKVFEYGPNKEVKEDYNGMVFEQGGCKLEVADGHRAVKPEVFKQLITSSKVSLMVSVDSISEFTETAKNAGIELAVGPRHYYWGTIEVVLKDPDGLVLVFIGPYSEEEAKKVSANETWAKPPKKTK